MYVGWILSPLYSVCSFALNYRYDWGFGLDIAFVCMWIISSRCIGNHKWFTQIFALIQLYLWKCYKFFSLFKEGRKLFFFRFQRFCWNWKTRYCSVLYVGSFWKLLFLLHSRSVKSGGNYNFRSQEIYKRLIVYERRKIFFFFLLIRWLLHKKMSGLRNTFADNKKNYATRVRNRFIFGKLVRKSSKL